ncbi:5-formyltetrahydrofolate cyclo-ligase [Nitrospina gracilis 3/211]|uniref:5-formyltetrahydrofolate cyclo-ligase n=1 Tax=Nitrospina gracilis (strain 3/211) TaxID=1266370 RepID=M1YWD3_NITG3|nr:MULTISPECIES: 5-formyltetrahydrofolate cyclo-ligase [Nitrospina]MCF8722991.1 5-formyltetrahydrofolate cyclo-ligase [Nitrospina sp. Nb-3]CCQ89961.1 5-formyltetrahydrofolate cyclo-ligase [Nitrospina gracilis 3/211]
MTRKTKQSVRQAVWSEMTREKAARFPFPIKGRIPNFKGAEAAVERLRTLTCYQKAKTLKCNPDSPQRPLRQAALEDGKTVFMAVPRLRKEQCFLKLDPAKIDPRNFKKAASISGSEQFGQPVTPQEMPAIDLISAGSVAVRRNGTRIGKGGGYSDLEFGIATDLKLITKKTVIVTTVHDLQVVDAEWEVMPYDIPLDWILTPTQSIECKNKHARPQGVLWDHLDPAMQRDIPILERLVGPSPQRE